MGIGHLIIVVLQMRIQILFPEHLDGFIVLLQPKAGWPKMAGSALVGWISEALRKKPMASAQFLSTVEVMQIIIGKELFGMRSQLNFEFCRRVTNSVHAVFQKIGKAEVVMDSRKAGIQ